MEVCPAVAFQSTRSNAVKVTILLSLISGLIMIYLFHSPLQRITVEIETNYSKYCRSAYCEWNEEMWYFWVESLCFKPVSQIKSSWFFYFELGPNVNSFLSDEYFLTPKRIARYRQEEVTTEPCP